MTRTWYTTHAYPTTGFQDNFLQNILQQNTTTSSIQTSVLNFLNFGPPVLIFATARAIFWLVHVALGFSTKHIYCMTLLLISLSYMTMCQFGTAIWVILDHLLHSADYIYLTKRNSDILDEIFQFWHLKSCRPNSIISIDSEIIWCQLQPLGVNVM